MKYKNFLKILMSMKFQYQQYSIPNYDKAITLSKHIKTFVENQGKGVFGAFFYTRNTI
ncbi:unnamed protein product [Acanthoscelides obtectus]|uniref:Uncharacterized protein n=1 Tax=Acanthoscelides obtectus TaxID=200917 RepID=A0A9P0LD30_ACAOB|nr:unnamed protein product [Acanthoscelides obtectus]CAK1681783.1 hypothetical protein AOBTE_LOCUS33269 [Acanthoscelides obtectus]